MVNILLGCTGSVAAIKVPALIQLLLKNIPNADIKVVVTQSAKHFFSVADASFDVLEDKDEWLCWSKIGDPVMHIELRNWSDVFIIAPLDANSLAKLAYGLCDNLLTCIARAWDIKTKHLLFCPAMNTVMWDHPSTEKNINILKEFGYIEVPPITKLLACGKQGMGAMAEIDSIVRVVKEIISTTSSRESASS